MNRFRSRKKSFNDASAEPSRRPSTESDVPALPIFSSKTFRRNKKTQPEPKPQLDLATVLPPSDNFRTSLMMPNLSARFSMLREQDDPHSKIGKANDDSVLFPKRASRMDLFNSGPLNNISEHQSIHAPIRPPFASSRTESYGSDGTNWTDDDRSMISRARPGEGNTMFGGRQKIYKIPVGASGSTKSFGNEEAPPRRGKAVYGDDLGASTFPKSYDADLYTNDGPDPDRDGHGRSSDERSDSPPMAKYNRNRETTSSTNSGPSAGRTSTAATSVASQRSLYGNHAPNGLPHAVNQGANHGQAFERSQPKSRRLYGQGLDQHMYDQQYSAMYRLESLHRQRAHNAPPPSKLKGSRSATSLNDHYQQSGPLYSSNGFRAGSPPPSGPPPNMGEFDLGLAPEPSDSYQSQTIGMSPPLSPPMSPTQDSTFVAALEPNDLGKATASGAFNKPSKQYSEQQYLERQLRLQEGRESPALIRPFSPSAASMDEQVTGRSRNVSLVGSQSKPGSALRQGEAAGNYRLGYLANNQHLPNRNSDDQYNPAMDSSFLSSMSGTASEVGSPLDSDNEQDLFPPSASYQSPVKTTVSDGDHQKANGEPHSTADLQNNKHHVPLPDGSSSDGRSEITVTEPSRLPTSIANHVDADSPTLGPADGPTSVNGLNGLVRAHLRNDSGQSSIYPEPSPGPNARFPSDVHKHGHSRNPSKTNEPTTFFRESTFEPENKGSDIHPVLRADASDMPPPLSLRARQILEQATALREVSPKVQGMLGQNKAQRVLGGEAPRPSHENLMSWQEQLRVHHARGGSTETEKEREGLATELAERRRAVQDNLRSFVDNESRSSSPAPGSRAEEPGQRRIPFGMLKSKTSRENMAGKQEQPSKAMKMLGIGPNSLPNGSPRPSQDGFARKQEEPISRPQTRDQRQHETNGQPSQARHRTQGRGPQRPGSRPDSLDKEPSPPASRSSRERSSSEASERRFLGRNVKPRDNVLIEEETLGGNNPISPAHHNNRWDNSEARPLERFAASMANTQDPERSQSAMGGRMRGNSRTAKAGYFDPRDGPTMHPNNPQTKNSPSTPSQSVRSAPSMHEGVSMISNDSIPIMIPPKSSHGAHGSPRHTRPHRKESVNKQDISEPIFKSCTSSVDVVDLPPGASLKNGMESCFDYTPPPIPPLNPRRKRTQTLLQAIGRLDNSHPVPSSTARGKADPYSDQSTFSADEGGHPRKPRHKLRKSSSEGGNMNARARQQAMMASSPAVPNFPQSMSTTQSPTIPHFPHNQQPHGHGPFNVPASAVMF
ncbi:MAG: hypothetical protein Q9168_001481 [Polycauliona sp. 1 TL-2023]